MQPTRSDNAPCQRNIAVARRQFLRLISAASLSLVGQGCASDEDAAWGERTVLRASINPNVEQSVRVLSSSFGQPIVHMREQLSIDVGLAQHLSLGDQCRVVRDNGNIALYTVGEIRDEQNSEWVRMGGPARARLGTIGSFHAKLQTPVVAKGLSDAQALAQNEFVERLTDDGVNTGLVVLAPHGGFIEPGTDEQAEFVRSQLANKGASSWICKGYKVGGGAFDQWHITSTELSRNSFPGLDRIADRGFAYAVSFHGLGEPLVLIGGRGPLERKLQIYDAITAVVAGSGIGVSIAQPEELNSGDSPHNVVNWLTAGGAGGIQIEQGQEARDNYGLAIAQAVVDVFDGLV